MLELLIAAQISLYVTLTVVFIIAVAFCGVVVTLWVIDKTLCGVISLLERGIDVWER